MPKYDFNWQLYYELATPLKIPAGSKLTAIAHYDNSPKNKWNPAPDREVYWSEQSWDEMYNPQIRWTWDLQEPDEDRLAARASDEATSSTKTSSLSAFVATCVIVDRSSSASSGLTSDSDPKRDDRERAGCVERVAVVAERVEDASSDHRSEDARPRPTP